jgi:predicted  nucleic acid-binding Zn-ribbon protein
MRDVQSETPARLLDLQAEDSAIRLLEHRRETLPEAQRLQQLNDQLAELDADIEIAEKQREEIGRGQSRLEGEITMLEHKIQNEETRLFSGKVANPRELSSLQAEVDMNRKKRAALEDDLLEVMVQKDQAEDTYNRLTQERDQVARDAGELSQTVSALLADIDAELQGHSAERANVAKEIPDDLLTRYERIRASHHGVGAAALVGGTCQGCHTQLPAREAERMKREGGLQRCENCGRILVIRS